MIDIDTATNEELIEEYEKCDKEWSKFSCDCFGFYIDSIQKKISINYKNQNNNINTKIN